MSVNKKCFVIFPFRKPYESQYKKIYKPALQESGLKAVRAGGPGVGYITKDIEKKIKESLICFADLTEENANVWYEVGYAYACGKKVVMVCNEDIRPLDKLPFDIKGRNIIGYSKAIGKNKKTRLEFQKNITLDAKAKMAKAQKATLAKKSAPARKDIPVILNASVPSKNPLDEVVCEKLTKRDIDVLRRIIRYCLAYSEGIAASDLKSTLSGDSIKVHFSLEKLDKEGYIQKANVPEARAVAFSRHVLGYIPTPKAMELAQNYPDLF